MSSVVSSTSSKRFRETQSLLDDNMSVASGSNVSRQRQSRKDEAIRKKIEQELSKKRGGSSRVRQTKKVAGTVSALRPAQALTVKENILIIEAAQLMAAKRSDCVLVVDEEDHLSGIFTAKDLAYRIVANSLDARTTTVAQIMTKGPMCVTADTSAQDALNLMVSRGFRHLPVCNDEGDIFGLLDITKCLYEALDKMERAFGSSRKLYDALEGVEKEWSNGPIQLVQYMEALREKMSCPDLNTVLDGAYPVEVSVKTQVRDVAKLMKEHHTTAVLVMDHGGLAGIFTSKDIVLRVIAAGLAPDNCSVVRVMTPHPDTAQPSTSILDALKKMHDGHYLNLPVLDEDKNIVGLVDVLKLTYATLEQINSIEGADNDGSKFWNSFAMGEHTETESAVSDSLSHAANSNMFQAPNSPHQERALSHLNFPEITPQDSASVANDENRSNVSSQQMRSRDDGTFAFKFTSAMGKTHRLKSDYTDFDSLKSTIRSKLMTEHLSLSQSYVEVVGSAPPSEEEEDWLQISYVDDENDNVLMTSNQDLMDAVSLARRQGHDRVRLHVLDTISNPVAPPAAAATTAEIEEKPNEITVNPSESEHTAPTAEETVDEAEKIHKKSKRRSGSRRDVLTSDEESGESDVDSTQRKRSGKRGAKRGLAEEYGIPIPDDLLLPAAVTFLGVVIATVFTISKVTASSSRY
ncbi:hypothetical protein BGW37DRAFT_485323 [Umbelopsis sp. PMI_123]|nr:hypothetical protein BGW37DRAFT_485323 [Umbelopsis sp. PMI_123]